MFIIMIIIIMFIIIMFIIIIIKDYRSDYDIFDKFNLLTDRTVMAHSMLIDN